MTLPHDDLSPGRLDHLVALLKGVVGIIPGGSIAAEAVAATVPKQRLDRVADLVRTFNDRLQTLESAQAAASALAELHELRIAIDGISRSNEANYAELLEKLGQRGLGDREQLRHLLENAKQYLEDAKIALARNTFTPVEPAFEAAIARSFAYVLSEPDRQTLLSADLRKLFFSVLNRHVRSGAAGQIVVTGDAGSGKTFNTLLLGMQLAREKYDVWYCPDVTRAVLSVDSLRTVVEHASRNFVVIIDDAHQDLLKASQLVTSVTRPHRQRGDPLCIFITQPLDPATFLDTFGANAARLVLQPHLIDFNRLVTSYFNALGRSADGPRFLQAVDSLPGYLRQDRNMAFWNELLRALPSARDAAVDESAILRRFVEHVMRREPHLIDHRETLRHLIPYFAHDATLHRTFAVQILGPDGDVKLDQLMSLGVVRLDVSDWETAGYQDTTALVVSWAFHRAKAMLLQRVYETYFDMHCRSTAAAFAEYALFDVENLYYMLGKFAGADDFLTLCEDSGVRAILRTYFQTRHFGKKFDRLLRRLKILDQDHLDDILTDEVLNTIALRANSPEIWNVSKLMAVKSLYQLSPAKAARVCATLRSHAIIGPFLADPTAKGVVSLAKWMEILKNIYRRTRPPDNNAQQIAREIVGATANEFIARIRIHDKYITQLHWMLKRLRGLKLAGEFLAYTTPAELVDLIRGKDTNIVELSRSLLYDTQWVFQDGCDISYYDEFKSLLTYDDICRVFANSRSSVLGLILNASNDIVCSALPRFVTGPEFARKVAREPLDRRRFAIRRVLTNPFIDAADRQAIVHAIEGAGNTSSGPLTAARS